MTLAHTPMPRATTLCLAVALLGGCDLFQLGIVEDPEPDAGTVKLRPDPGGPEPGPLERCDGVATSVGYGDADDGYPVFSGEASLLGGRWTVRATPEDAPDTLELAYAPPDALATATWIWKFSSRRLGEPLREISYPGALASPTAEQPNPGLDVTSATRTCAGAVGAFRIHELVIESRQLVRFLATFEQRCGRTVPALRGCVRYLSTP